MAGKITTATDAEVGFYEDIPVVRANGEATTLGAVDNSVIGEGAGDAVGPGKPSKGRGTKPAPKSAAKAQGKNGANAGSKTAAKKGGAVGTGRVAKALTAAEQAAADSEKQRKADALKARKAEAAKKQAAADKKRKAAADAKAQRVQALREKLEAIGGTAPADATWAQVNDALQLRRQAVADQKKKDREEKEAQAAINKLHALGFTGDPEADAEYSAVISDARALAVQPINQNAVSLGWLEAPGVALTKTGLLLSEDVGLNVWAKTVSALMSLGDVSQFALGDALVYGENHFGNQYDHVTEALGISRSAVKNAKYVAASWPVEERVEGLSFTHHFEAAWLYRENPAAARNILETAKYDMRSTAWVREQVQEYRNRQAAEGGEGGEGEGIPLTPAQKRREVVDALTLATTEQSERDLALKGSPRKIEKAKRDELVALVEYAETNELVPAESVLRNITRLQRRIDDLEGENQLLREKITQYEKNALYREGANDRVLNGEVVDLGSGVIPGTDDTDLLSYLGVDEGEDEDEDEDEDAWADAQERG